MITNISGQTVTWRPVPSSDADGAVGEFLSIGTRKDTSNPPLHFILRAFVDINHVVMIGGPWHDPALTGHGARLAFSRPAAGSHAVFRCL